MFACCASAGGSPRKEKGASAAAPPAHEHAAPPTGRRVRTGAAATPVQPALAPPTGASAAGGAVSFRKAAAQRLVAAQRICEPPCVAFSAAFHRPLSSPIRPLRTASSPRCAAQTCRLRP